MPPQQHNTAQPPAMRGGRASPTSTDQGYKCSFCGNCFGRREHLTRHIRSHTSEKPYTCRICGKPFSRQDVLNRHITSHQPRTTLFSTRQTIVSARACKECATSRVRCSRTQPCRRCAARALMCEYPPARRTSSAKHNAQEPTNSQVLVLDEHLPYASHQPFPALSCPPQTHDLEQDISAIQQENQTISVSSTPLTSSGIPNGSSELSDHQSALNPAGLNENWRSTGNLFTAHSVRSNGNLVTSFEEHGNYLGDSNHSESLDLSINWMSPPYDLDLSWMNGLDSQIAVVSGGSIPGNRGISVSPAAETNISSRNELHETYSSSPSRCDDTGTVSTGSSSHDGTLYVEGSITRAPFKGRRTYDSQVATRDTDKENIHSRAQGLSVEAYESLRRNVSASAASNNAVLRTLPTLEKARELVAVYFSRFHPIYPFLPRSTRNLEQPANWMLLLAVIATGSTYSDESHHSSISQELFAILHLSLRQYSEDLPNGLSYNQCSCASDSPEECYFHRQLPVLQSVVLDTMHELHGGNIKAVHRASASRHRLVDTCRAMSLLEIGSVHHVPDYGEGAEIEEQEWLKVESRLRTGLMIWLLDSICVFQFGLEPLMRVDDLKGRLPCCDSRWNRNLTKLTPTGPSSRTAITVGRALEMLFMEKRLPPNLDEFGTSILIYAILRRTKEAFSHYRSALAAWTPNANVQSPPACTFVEESWPPSLSILSRWRNSACDCLDILHWHANSIVSDAAGWEHPTIFHLHLSRLLLLSPTSHLQTLAQAAASPSVGGKPDHQRAASARRHILQWAIQDQYKARLSIIHAGALLWHVRRYSVGNFLEPFGIFLATMATWAYSTAMQLSSRSRIAQPTSTTSPTPPLPMEDQFFVSHSPAAAIGSDQRSDKQDEELAPEFLHLDRPCDDEMVQAYVRWGYKMSGHMSRVGDICSAGAPKRILEQGIQLLALDQTNRRPALRRTDPGKESEEEATRGCRGRWGAYDYYADLLGSLVASLTLDYHQGHSHQGRSGMPGGA
ncbi:hypothetical protein B0I35DRAFT_379449 [Stachybotrys elegans]|uniref:Uncharacterized protein n=1 Tax=Stachybotrys elegans TaxID=80388 RepID=A0A8K0SP03_9HYPO|nr:hypothetical protein B0I35DRAFT_379449 [Stachybotrys elegans]